MRIICLIPSITETLISCGVEVVGRTRFCIHPEQQVNRITKVGGTKDIDWNKCKTLEPDLVILDKEENTKSMADSCPYPYIVLHITNLQNIASELNRLASQLNNSALVSIARRWQKVAESPITGRRISSLPGIIQWWRRPSNEDSVKTMQYMIWKDPWMAIGEGTFIHSVLSHLGFSSLLGKHCEKYPQIDLQSFDQNSTLLLLSSEPFPFQRHQTEVEAQGFNCALVDGEKFSWYGIRSLEFLEHEISKQAPSHTS